MKKIVVLLIALLLVGCSQVEKDSLDINTDDQTVSIDEESPKLLSILGELNLDRELNKLKYKLSTSWQHMRYDVDDNLVGKYDQWNVSIYTDTNLVMVFGYIEDDESEITKSYHTNKALENLKNNELKNCGYSLVDTIQIDNRYGFIVDKTEGKITKRMLYINDDGGKYQISFFNQTDSLSSLELQYAYDYYKSLHFTDGAAKTNS